jgi:choice-of-anchor C domain-containing protein
MRLHRVHTGSGLVVFLWLALARMAGAQMITNGDFEAGPAIPPSPGTMSVAPGNTALTGWTVTGGAITIVTDTYWQPQSGTRSIMLSSSGPGAIQQSFATSAGHGYRLTFYLSGEPFSTPAVKHLRVQAGATTQDYAKDISDAWHWDMKWQALTLDFTAAGSSTTVTFSSLDAGAWGPAIETASVEAVSTGVESSVPGLALAPIRPDPVLGATRVAFALPDTRTVRLSVVDVRGRRVAWLADGRLDAGPHDVTLSPRAIGLGAGLDFLVLDAGDRTVVRRFTTLQ